MTKLYAFVIACLLLARPALAQMPTTFSPVATYSTGAGSQPVGLAVADVNGDSWPDLLTANYNTSTVGVQLGTGTVTGSFGPVVAYSTGAGSYPSSVAVADVNSDGKPDIITANFNNSAAGVLLGTGTGTFGAVAAYSTGVGSYPRSIVVADVNGDGRPDLLAANYRAGTAGVLLGTGTGAFGAVVAYSTGAGSSPRSLVVADVNGDGKPDLLAANQGSSNSAGVLLGTGTGTFGTAATYGTGVASRDTLSIAVADVNGDGKPDLLAAHQNSKLGGVLLGTGTGTFGAVTTFSTGADSSPRSLTVADLNSDGLPDLLLANFSTNTVGVLLGIGTGGFSPTISFSAGSSGYPSAFVAADVNVDGQSDIITTNQYGNTVGVLWNTTVIIGLLSLRTFDPVATYGTGTDSRPQALAVADINSDGKPDIVTANENRSVAIVQLGTGTGTFGPATGYGGSLNNTIDLAVADVNGDGKPDIITTIYSYSFVSVQLNTGTGSFGLPAYYGTGPGVTSNSLSVAVADVNGDGKPDILTANPYSQTVGVLLGTGTGTFGSVTTFSTGPAGPTDLAVADVNSDGKLDIVTVNVGGSTASVLLGTGAGSFGTPTTYGTGAGRNLSGLAVADVNGDSKPDILVTNSAANKVLVLPGTGTGTFGAMSTYNTGAGSLPIGLAVADVNGDGKPDIVTANAGTNTAGVLLGTGTGGFGPVTTFSAGPNSQPYAIAVADVNGDGRKDLLIANYSSSTSGVLLNTGTVLATPARAAASPVLVTVHPNPVSGQPLLLALAGLPAEARQVQAMLVDAVGRAVSTASLPAAQGVARASLPTTGLPAGVYLLRLSARDAQGATLGALPTQRLQVE